MTQGEFGSFIVKNATKLVSAARVEKGQELDLTELSFSLIQSCTEGSVLRPLPLQASFKSDRIGEFLAALKVSRFSQSTFLLNSPTLTWKEFP